MEFFECESKILLGMGMGWNIELETINILEPLSANPGRWRGDGMGGMESSLDGDDSLTLGINHQFGGFLGIC